MQKNYTEQQRQIGKLTHHASIYLDTNNDSRDFHTKMLVQSFWQISHDNRSHAEHNFRRIKTTYLNILL